MDRVILDAKLESLRRCVARVQARCPATVDALLNDLDAQDVVTLNLTRAVQLCVDLAMHRVAESNQPTPQTMGEAFIALERLQLIDAPLCLRMRNAVGFRNLAVREYSDINWAIVFSIATTRLDDFRLFARALAS